jgi:two-component system, response regulator
MVDILLVEDDPGDAELAIRAFKKNGFTGKLVHLMDGQAALDFIFGNSAGAGDPETTGLRVIVLDLKLPKVSGSELLKRIKADPATRSIPVVVMTSSRQSRDIISSYDLGANSYIVKPLQFDEYMKTVGDLGNYWLNINESCC